MPDYKHPSLKGQLPAGVPTADQEALQEPWFDPVTIGANMGAGLFEAGGEDLGASLLSKAADDYESLRNDMLGNLDISYKDPGTWEAMTNQLEQFRDRYKQLKHVGPSIMEHISHLARGTINPGIATGGSQLTFGALAGRHNDPSPYLQTYTGKPLGRAGNNLLEAAGEDITTPKEKLQRIFKYLGDIFAKWGGTADEVPVP